MNEIKTDLLVTTFTHLFKHRRYFQCNDGWFELIWNLSLKLEKLIIEELEKQPEEKKENFCFCTDVKELCGSLIFYMSYSTDQMHEYIEEAEEASKKICEVCGEPGMIRPGAWYFTRCDKCFKEEYKEFAEYMIRGIHEAVLMHIDEDMIDDPKECIKEALKVSIASFPRWSRK